MAPIYNKICAGVICGCLMLGGIQAAVADLKDTVMRNPAPYIPPQCYTKTVDADGTVHNTCYPCHTRGFRPDFINDADLQEEYVFPADAEKNHWTNLFKDRSRQTAAISDRRILDYVRSSNYFDPDGDIALARALRKFPVRWDADGDNRWSGFVPDCRFRFDGQGFDRDPSGGYTGWRAFAHYPFPATHWPTNGSFSDVLIRLPKPFRTRKQRFDLGVYRLNLAILESLIKRREIAIPATDEKVFGVDLDKDGRVATATRVAYDWAPLEGRTMYFVGDAGELQREGKVHLAAGLFPVGTEFLQTLRYIDIGADGRVRPAPRVKEIRYARKIRWRTYAELETLAMNEIKEKTDFPDRLKLPVGNFEDGLSNGRGWRLQGFIEDAGGRLRPQSLEETAACIGCHGGIGATTDSTFSFARKLDASGHRQGWFHWSQKDLRGVNEPMVRFKNAGLQYEYCFYLMYSLAGDEFRANSELMKKCFDPNGRLKPKTARIIHDDLSFLLYPSPQRALALNKAFRVIAAEQSYTSGRYAIVGAAANVYQEITPQDTETRIATPVVRAEFPRYTAWGDGRRPSGPLIADRLRTTVSGKGMGGPNGQRYQILPDGLIDESTYSIHQQGFYFPFPARHTLPTRIIVPNAAIPGCYNCHRLTSPMPPKDPQIRRPVAFPNDTRPEKGRVLIQLTRSSGIDTNAVWSPDGKRIAWASDRSGRFQVWVMEADGSRKHSVSHGPAVHGWPSWSPDGSRLVFWGYEEKTGRSYIAVAASDGSGHTVLVESEESLDRPTWRSDGKYIAYAEQRDGNWDIWVISIDGRHRHRLTHDAQMETNPLWSPDGKTIAYKVAPNKEYNLTIQNFVSVEKGFDKPSYRLWDGVKSIQMNSWSPDGQKIAYTAEAITNASGRDRVSYLAVVDKVSLTGSKTAGSPIVLSAGRTLGDRGPVFSPSGQKVAFWAWDKNYRAGLWVVDSNGSNLSQVTAGGADMYPCWHPDGKVLLFESARSGNADLWTVSID